MALSLRRLRGTALAAAMTLTLLTPTGCTLIPGSAVAIRFADTAGVAQARTIRVEVTTPMRTQAIAPATAAAVHHYTFRLFTWTGSALGTGVATGEKSSASPTFSASFNNVPDGDYKITVQAYGSAGTGQPLSPQTESTNVATVSSGTVTGSPLLVPLNLNDGQPNQIHPAITPANGRPTGEGGMAPDDSGSASALHDYTVTIGPTTSTFVWIPRFTAYQVINPTPAGHPGKTAGTWVGTTPSGTPDVDWRKAEFGGFYAGKYEASRGDATSSSAGTSTIPASRPGVVPWTNVTWDQAAMACLNYPNGHLMTDEEWTALAVHAQINGVSVRGNNGNSGTVAWDVDDNLTTFSDDPTENGAGVGRALTGSGGATTSHTSTNSGVHDLHGNVGEWTASLAKHNANTNWVIDGMTTAQALPTTADYVVGQLTLPLFQRLGIPALSTTPNADFGNDMAYFGGDTTDKRIIRGGMWQNGSNAGLWCMVGTQARTTSDIYTGFRLALTF